MSRNTPIHPLYLGLECFLLLLLVVFTRIHLFCTIPKWLNNKGRDFQLLSLKPLAKPFTNLQWQFKRDIYCH